MGMYTEFLFQGETKANLPKDIQELFDYYFGECFGLDIGNPDSLRKLPDHEFFKCDRWDHIGHTSSYYFSPFSLRHSQNNVMDNMGKHVFLLCNLKNYGDEIKLFLDWIDPYMDSYWGHYCYEEDEQPKFFKVRR